ncbi:hypothetical protein N566_14260 [Streptomycetaceae bacterium MP113-05]|nr:hypothetical protein N566_14260 [Streptomycetaceae bacterium MP113-05]
MFNQNSRESICTARRIDTWCARQNTAITTALSRNVATCDHTASSASSSSAPSRPLGSWMSSTSSVRAIATTPSVSAVRRSRGT